MKKLFLMFILLCTTVIGALAQTPSPKTLSGGWTRVWSDEFIGSTLNTGVWNVEQVPNPANNELQCYNDDGVSVSNGNLVLTAKRATSGTKSFTSGRVNSQGKYAFKYGKIEARVKIPKTYKGLWPAFWMMGDDLGSVGWPACGELDIFEMGHQDGFTSEEKSERFLNGCLHYGPSVSDHYQSPNPSTTLSFSVQDRYVIFGCEWNFNQIRCYVREDGTNTAETTYFTQANTGDAANYFNKPFHILFNLAVGGDFPGILDPAGVTALPNDGNTASMYVDYVAVYKKAPVAPVDGNYFNASTTTVNSKFATSTWGEDNSSTASWDPATGKVNINISSDKNEQWQGKVFLKTSDIVLDPSKQYKFSCKVYANNAVNDVTVKLFDNAELYCKTDNSLVAGDNTIESTSFNGGSVGNGVIVFDFGFAKSGDKFTISDIKIEEVGSVATFPSSAAPVPTQPAANVKSLYSDSYTFAPSSSANYNANWDQATQLAPENIGGNNYLHYSSFNWLGWDFGATDFSDMKYLHIDVCPKRSGTLNVYPISIKNGVTTEKEYTLTGLTEGEWKSFDIPLTEFAGLDFSSICQMKFAGASGFDEFCVDNVYFYKPVVYSLIGGYNGKNGWNMGTDAIDFVYNEAQGNYTVTIPSIYGKFKIVKNHQWDGVLSCTTSNISAGNSYEFYPDPREGDDYNAKFEGTLENVKLTLTPNANSNNVTLKVELNEYFINTADELQAFAQGVNSGNVALDAKAYLMADIDMANLTSGTYPGIGDADHKFAGEFVSLSNKSDKNSKVEHIVNLGTSATTGVFNYVNGATIEGVNVKGTINATTNNVGALVNNSTGNTTIVNCDNAASVTSTGDNVGGLVGKVWNNNNTTPNTLTIRNVVNRGNVTASTKASGIVGRIDNTNLVMTNALNEGAINSSKTAEYANAAGLVGCQIGSGVSVTVVNSGNAGDITGKSGECAAFAGWIESTTVNFTNCYNSGVITGQEGNKNLVRADNVVTDPAAANTIWHNVYDASTAAGGTPSNKDQGWTLKQDQTPWTQNDVLDGTLLGVVNSVDVSSYTARLWVQTFAADLHPVFVASAPVTITAEVQDKTNTTAIIHIAPIATDGLPITLKYEWLKPEAPTKNGEGVANDPVKETHYHTIIAKTGEHIYTPVMNLENFANQTVHVMVGNKEVAGPFNFTTLDHQKVTDIPAAARGELMKNNVEQGTLRPIVDFEPDWKGFKDVENYNYNAVVDNGTYSYTMPNATNERWQAQFRIPIGSENDKVVSLSPNYDYDVKLTIKSSKPANLIFKLESSGTGWRNKDGETSIITNDHGTLTAVEIGTDGYVYQIENLKGQYLPGAILVVDLSQADANTAVTISNISVIEKARTSEGTVVDANKNSGLLTGSKNTVTNHSVALDMKGYDKGGETFVDGKEVIYTITTNVGTAETPNIKSWTTTGIGGQLSTYVVYGLDKNTTYTFNIKAQLEDGNIVGAKEGVDVTAATALDDDIETLRGTLTLNAGISQTTKKTADLYMNAANGTSETITYRIYEGAFTAVTDAEGKTPLATTIGTAGKNTTYTMRDLIPNTEYVYTIVAEDQDGQKTFQVVRPITTDGTAVTEFDNTVDGTAKYVWLNGTNTSYRQEVPYTYSFNLNYNEDGTLTMIGGVGHQGENTESVSDAVGIVLPHVFIKKYGDAEFTDVQAPAGKPTEFYCTAPGSYDKGDVVEVKVKYEYNGLNGENQFTTPTMRFVVDNSGEAKTYHYFNENYTTLDEYMGTSKRVRIIRAIKAGHWNTFCVPFSVTKAKLIESMNSTHENMTLSIHHLDGLTVDANEKYTMKFTENEGNDVTLTAGKPYLVKIAVTEDGYTPSTEDQPAADAAITSFNLVDDAHPIQLNTFVPAPAVSKDQTDESKTVRFQASYTALTNPNYVPRGAYIINRSQIRYVNSDVQMLGFRGYFLTGKGIKSTSSSDGSDVNNAKVSLFYVFMDDIDDGVITGINIGRDTIDPTQPVFNVSGQRVSGAVKGILIQNGRKFVNK